MPIANQKKGPRRSKFESVGQGGIFDEISGNSILKVVDLMPLNVPSQKLNVISGPNTMVGGSLYIESGDSERN
jgi:hypothetical protein